MDLIIDFGNTLAKVAVYEGNQEKFFRAFPAIEQKDLEFIVNSWPLRRSIVSSVMNHPEWTASFLEKHTIYHELTGKTTLPVTLDYSTPETLGKDRIAAAVAGHMLYPRSNVLVIMAGTCITYDFTNQRGIYCGGAISPGMDMRFRALHHFTDQLPLCHPEGIPPLTGTSTRESIQSGVINGIMAEMDGIIGDYQKIYKSLTVILSGGDLNYFDKRLKNNIFAVPNIVLRGLKFILDFHATQ